MGPSLNIKGGVRVYLLNKSVPRIRRIVKQLRMPKHVVDHMNDYAAEVRAVGKTTAELERDGAHLGAINEAIQLKPTLIELDYNVEESSPRQQSREENIVPSDMHPKDTPSVITPVIPIANQEEVQTEPTSVPEVPLQTPAVSPNKKKTTTFSRTNVSEENIITTKRVRKPSAKIQGSIFQMTLNKALQSEASEAAKNAAMKELKQLVDRATWVYLKQRSDATPSTHNKETPCSMFLKPKHDAMGVFTLWKARLVNGGHMTDPTRYDPFEKTAPTVSLEIVYIILNIAVSKKLKIESFDVPGAYLNAELQPGKYHKMRINKSIAALLMQVDPKLSPNNTYVKTILS